MSSITQQQLICLLQKAYSGELAAAYAYRGHWKSVKNSTEKEKIFQIEQDEWNHREKVSALLQSLNAQPLKRREIIFKWMGRAIGFLCHFTGWFFPMFFAGKVETRNVKEYDTAALVARELGLVHLETELSHMASVEKEHEVFFLGLAARHRFFPLMQKIF